MTDDFEDEIVESLLKYKKRLPPAPFYHKRPFQVLGLMLALVLVSVAAFASYSFATKPRGKITFPVERTRTARDIRIAGYTKNITRERPHVWIVVTVEELGRCWPKRACDKPNTMFDLNIHEGGPLGPYKVALYAVDRECHDKIKEWFDKGIFGGLPLLPEDYKLDEVELVMQGT